MDNRSFTRKNSEDTILPYDSTTSSIMNFLSVKYNSSSITLPIYINVVRISNITWPVMVWQLVLIARFLILIRALLQCGTDHKMIYFARNVLFPRHNVCPHSILTRFRYIALDLSLLVIASQQHHTDMYSHVDAGLGPLMQQQLTFDSV